jgi:hypothetical protein
MREADLQRQILDYLALKRIFHYRNNSGGFRDSHQHFYRFGALGSPAIICVINGRYIGIEVKAPRGRQNDNQIEFQRQLEKAGGKYILVYNLDDVVNELAITAMMKPDVPPPGP